MDRVWGYAAALDTGTVTVHMRRLRAKIELDPAQPAAPRDRLGRRLPVRAVIGSRSSSPLRTLAAGLAATLALRLLPTVRLQLAGLALLAVCCRCRRAAVRLGDVPHGRRREDPRGRRGGRIGRRRAALVLARSIARRIERLRAASARARGGRPRGARARGRPARARGARPLVQRDGREPREPLRRAPRARGRRKPRPAHADRVDHGDARGDRGRPRRRLSEYLAPLQEQARRLSQLVEDLFELARIDAGALASSCRVVALAPLVESCLRGFEAEARARRRAARARATEAPRRALRARAGRARAAQPAHERPPAHALGRNGRSRRRRRGRATCGCRRGHGRRHPPDGGAPDVRPLLARRLRTRRRRRGGLGLAIARGLVEAQGGTHLGRARATGGARVSFTLPLAGS